MKKIPVIRLVLFSFPIDRNMCDAVLSNFNKKCEFFWVAPSIFTLLLILLYTSALLLFFKCRLYKYTIHLKTMYVPNYYFFKLFMYVNYYFVEECVIYTRYEVEFFSLIVRE